MNNMRITTSEIAKICNVSQGTVDRALNNRTGINAETKLKILKVAKQYGYREYIPAQPDRAIGQIGVIVFDLNNEYFSQLITELEYALRVEGLGATIMLTHYDRQYEIECIRELYNMGVQGIVLCSVNGGPEFENYLKLFDIPIVAVGNRTTDMPYVGIDDAAAMKDMAERVFGGGFENVIYFSPALRYPDAYAQTARYRGFLSAAGDKAYSVVTNIEDIKESYGAKTAILCSTDHYALQVYFKAAGATIFGFDNVRALEKYKINIDSVGYSMEEIATGAVDIIKKKKRGSILIKHYIAEHP